MWENMEKDGKYHMVGYGWIGVCRVHSEVIQCYWDRLTLLPLPKVDDQICGGEIDRQETWSN